MTLLELFFGFLKVGCFAFGGAYGAIPLIRDVVLSYGWLDDEMLTYMIAVSESTPGPIMVNLATYVGSSQAGILGSVAATLAVVLPSFIIIVLVTAILKTVLKNPYVQAVLRGVKPCMIGIILATGVYMIIRNGIVIGDGVFQIRSLILTLVLGAIYFGSRKIRKGGISPILLICLSASRGSPHTDSDAIPKDLRQRSADRKRIETMCHQSADLFSQGRHPLISRVKAKKMR